jgi:hypothetical protein
VTTRRLDTRPFHVVHEHRRPIATPKTPWIVPERPRLSHTTWPAPAPPWEPVRRALGLLVGRPLARAIARLIGLDAP